MKASVSGTAGLAFAAVFKALKVVRPDRPIHPAGVALTGVIERRPGSTRSGISWIDSPGSDPVSARFSRSLGLPPGWPDILGLALRIPTETGPADVLLASTAVSRPGRLILTAHRYASNGKLTSLMPYKGSKGPVLLAAVPQATGQGLPATPDAFRQALATATWTLGLYHARLTGPWNRFGTLVLTLDPGNADVRTRFDPLSNPLPGAGTYEWTRRLRRPSYQAARQRSP
ncbi:hypothetical protein [Arthrobacter sp. ES3-54]|jgi:hypothetical protein|uniref:hypothetical protein n=1 Tax=Arthrobacter sp. ES3-54 TaxID=1502991 RepID=UPI0024068294|nr:hypothetical protein [Arthrobacter sp. ES3-54]MDF9750437.1 hypothetical protein [Arthrobacter sp. ES3-54]